MRAVNTNVSARRLASRFARPLPKPRPAHRWRDDAVLVCIRANHFTGTSEASNDGLRMTVWAKGRRNGDMKGLASGF